jgi:ketosteroid isomerase-like protein
MTMPEPIRRLVDAINTHNPDTVAAAFTDDYHCEMPLHPSRSFTGSDQVRDNYAGIFARTPDLRAEVLRCVDEGDVSWSEWEMRGTGPGGTPVVMRGVVIATAPASGPISRTRFYLDPVVDN